MGFEVAFKNRWRTLSSGIPGIVKNELKSSSISSGSRRHCRHQKR